MLYLIGLSEIPCVIAPICLMGAKKALLSTTLINTTNFRAKTEITYSQSKCSSLKAGLGTNQEKRK